MATCLECKHCFFAADARAYCKIDNDDIVTFHWIKKEDVDDEEAICLKWEEDKLPPRLQKALDEVNKKVLSK